jgi:YHS domain-containing protein
MVQDPVCHVYLPSLEAIQRTQDQKTYYFCSRQCAEKFSKPYRV